VSRRNAEVAARESSLRAKIVFYVLLAFACGIVSRFFFVQVHDGPKLAERAYEQRLTTIDFAAHRGTIYDRDGTPLVRSLPSQSLYATTRDVQNPVATARTLARLLHDVSYDDILAALQSKAAYVQVDHKIGRDEADRIAELALPGLSIVPERTGVRFAPSGRLASTVLGFTGYGENGLAGVEYAYDDVLRGSPGQMELETDEFGRAIPFATPKLVVAEKPGHSLVLTLDSYLQYSVEHVLHDTVAKWHAKSGSAIVMDPWNGEILALANVPDYDVRDYAASSPDDRRDRAVEDAYEPGSVFKLITATAALESGKVTPTDRFPARDRLQIGGATIYNAEDGFLANSSASETLGEIIEKSHNVGAAEVGLRIGKETLYDMVRRYGFGEPTDVGLPGESPGIVPALPTWSDTTLPTVAFGQGIATTPIALVRAYAAIANGGLLLRPRIVAEVLDANGAPAQRYGREVVRRVMSARTAAILRGYLRAVVTHGTGDPTAQVPGYTTAGKTGTAQIAENGVYAPGQYVASFVGFIPADVPRYVILVKVERPNGAIYGSIVAAPAFAVIARIAMLRAGVLPSGPRLVREAPPSKQKQRT